MTVVMLLKKIMMKLIARFHDRFAQAVSCETIQHPMLEKLLDKSIVKTKYTRMILSSFDEYEIYEGQTKLCIDLEKRQCPCGGGIMTRIPCKHMVHYVHHKRVEL
jgi:hypothetical protein